MIQSRLINLIVDARDRAIRNEKIGIEPERFLSAALPHPRGCGPGRMLTAFAIAAFARM